MTNTTRSCLAIALLACIPLLGACGRHDDSQPHAAGEPTSALGSIVKNATDEARRKLETGNISISDGVHVEVNGHTIRRPSGKTKAEITPRGELLVDGKAVDIDPAQRALLLRYRRNIIDVAGAGMEIGVQGADLGMKAAHEALSSIFSGEGDKVEEKIKPQAQKIEAAALKLCDLLPPMLATQQQLAASLPAFQPYATMTQDDVSDCRKHRVGAGDAAMRAQIRDGIRNDIRSGIRESIRAPVRVVRGDDAAPAAGQPSSEPDATDSPATR